MPFPEGHLGAVIARSHVILVHFPVALLLVAVWFEFVGRRTAAAVTLVRLGALGALAAAWTGWSLADLEPVGSSQADLLFYHRWTGVTVLTLSVVALLIRRFKDARFWRPVLLATAAAVAVAGHLGGELVHGDIFAYDEPPVASTMTVTPTADPAEPLVDYATQIQPLLETHCYSCHGPDKAKGKLRLNDLGALFANPSKADIIRPGDAAHSELYRRISLPHDDLDVMPAKGDPLSPDQIELVKTWIDQGAHWTAPAGKAAAGAAATSPGAGPAGTPGTSSAATPAPKLAGSAAGSSAVTPPGSGSPVSQQAAPASKPEPLDPAVTAALDRLVSRGAGALPVAVGEDRVEVSFATLGAGATDADLALLEALGDHLVALDLSRTAVTDEGLATLASFPSLRQLKLDWTSTSDAGLVPLAALPRLESLNLVGTPVGDGGLDALADLSALQTLYLWNSAVSAEGVERLRAALPDTRIVYD